MILNNLEKIKVVGLNIDNNVLNDEISLQLGVVDNRQSSLDSIKFLNPKLVLKYGNKEIPLESIINIRSKVRIDIQLLDDEFIDEDDWEDVEDSTTEEGENSLEAMTFEDAFLDETFLSDEWRKILKIVSAKYPEYESAKICSEIYSKIYIEANNWLKLLLN